MVSLCYELSGVELLVSGNAGEKSTNHHTSMLNEWQQSMNTTIWKFDVEFFWKSSMT